MDVSKLICKYGASCYRKNPDHFKQYSHPGRREGEEVVTDQSTCEEEERRSRPSKAMKAGGSSAKSPIKAGGTITSYFERQPDPGKGKGKESKRSPDRRAESAGEAVGEDKESCLPPAKRQKQEAELSPSTEKETSGGNVVDANELVKESDDVKENLKRKFLVMMPDEFYQFWEFCKSLNPSDPQAALDPGLGFMLVGPYDVLSGRLRGVPWEKCVLHNRHFYDPPEMVTVLEAVSDDLRGFHLGYFRDTPGDINDFWVVSNSSKESCEIKIEGKSMFTVVRLQRCPSDHEALEHLVTGLSEVANCFCMNMVSKTVTLTHLLEEKSLSAFQKKQLSQLVSWLDTQISRLGFTSLPVKELNKQRSKEVVTKCFHKMGIVVPYDRKTELGYRPLPLTDRELWKLLNKIAGCSGDKARCDQAFEPLQEIITFVQFANDECDYGMGLELGLNLFSHGDPYFHNVISHLLPLAYDLLCREEYGKIIQKHLSQRHQTPLDYKQ